MVVNCLVENSTEREWSLVDIYPINKSRYTVDI